MENVLSGETLTAKTVHAAMKNQQGALFPLNITKNDIIFVYIFAITNNHWLRLKSMNIVLAFCPNPLP